MPSVLFAMSVETFAARLRSLSEILAKAGDAANPQARLAPDMFTLAHQVQLACFHAANGAAQLMGQAAVAMGEPDATAPELKTRIDRTVAALDALNPAAFASAEDRSIVIPGPPGMEFHMSGREFLRDWALPHFYFHLVTAYDILRHEGVPIGKRDYLSGVARHLKPKAA
jgi:hypothetical protein